MRSVIQRWNQWWFPQSDGFDLAVCRLIVVGAQLFVFLPFFLPTPSEHLALIGRPGGFEDPQWLIRLLTAVLPADSIAWPHLVRGAFAIAVGAGITTLIGLRTRISAALFASANWFLVSHHGSYGDMFHEEIVLSMFLLFLALSPSGLRLSLDARLRRSPPGRTDMAVWPLRLTQVLLAWSYFSNGVAKLAYSGLEWMNGYTLQGYLLHSSVQWGDRPFGQWLAQQHDLSVALSIATVASELAFPLVLFSRRVRPILLAWAVTFHLGVYWSMGIPFLQHVVLFAVFLDFRELASWAERILPRRRVA
jgi:uncharacterized membrane protein YphA (DoxX/SURF4 family)